jgi:hypothetical protein
MFPSYCRGSGFSVNTLDKMRMRYKDIEEAMSFTKDTALLAAFERAAKLAKAAEKIDDTMVFIDRFDNDGLLGPAPVKADTKGNAVNVNVNNYSKETKATDELIYHSYLQNLGEDRSVNKDGATEQATTDND